ncbi:DUF2339 domain-containing protein [Pseudomonas sp. Irchel 3E20]|uniref:DUF2339 domain-containing protein n=1 Tax=Pseudomonas sp. Irchel 3E20 TaxID=2008983 RepID=UPI000BA3B5DF|nr:DUF2339 domain-containing protein [Pseudomonas sp. Irchel 3E20]
MQWMFMLIGLLLGWLLDEEPGEALVGALLGLGLGQAIVLSRLGAQAAVQGQALAALEQRLALVESPAADVQAPAPAPVPVEPEPVEPEPVMAAAPEPTAPAQELVWELPADLPTAEPTPADPWQPAAPQQPAPPRTPNLIDRAIASARNWLLGGNTVLRVGVLLLFLGLAFLLRYATEGVVVPLELRYAGVAAVALGLLGLGWWLRLRNRQYAVMLQGAGIGVLYLTVFAAMRLHPLIDPTAALGLLVAVTVFCAILAVTQDALALAAAAALGGFAAPILTSTGAGSHVALFSYFALLNTGILAIAWFKAWRLLNVIGFVGTFGIGLAWGLRAYTPELLWSTEPFLILFFLMYLAIGLLFTRRRLLEMPGAPADDSRAALLQWAARKGDYVDGTLLFGPPLVGFGLQFALVQHLEFAAAFSALALGIVYMALARMLAGGRALLLSETCLALGVIFASLAIPLGLDARWTSAAWAVEGAGIVWLGLRQQRVMARAFALLLQAGAALAFVSELRGGQTSLLDAPPLGALLLGVALLFSFWQLRRAAPPQRAVWEGWLLPGLAGAGLGFVYLLAPLLFQVPGTTIGWALLGLLSLLAGLRLASRTVVACALAVQVGAGLMFFAAWLGRAAAEDATVLAHASFWAPLALGLAGLIGAWRLHRQTLATAWQPLDLPRLSAALSLWGALWWARAWASEILRFAPTDLHTALLLVALALSMALWAWLALRLRWPMLALLCTGWVPVAAVVLVAGYFEGYHPAVDFGWLAWPLLFAVHFLSLRRLAPMLPARALSAAHVLGCWLLIGVLALELRYAMVLMAEQYNAWRWLGWALLPSLYLVLAALPRAWPWPVSAYAREYRVYAALPLAGLMLVWFWLANAFSAGNAEPLPYVPLLNPLELGLLFALFGVYLWSRSAAGQWGQWGLRADHAQRLGQLLVGVSLFAFFTALVMRGAHQWSGVPFELDALLASMRVQAGLSIVWTLMALGLMIGGHLRHRREVWLVGAALIALVVAKLFFVELSNRGGLARIVSFIGVGVLLLVVGYFAPLPPKRVQTPANAGNEKQGVSS